MKFVKIDKTHYSEEHFRKFKFSIEHSNQKYWLNLRTNENVFVFCEVRNGELYWQRIIDALSFSIIDFLNDEKRNSLHLDKLEKKFNKNKKCIKGRKNHAVTPDMNPRGVISGLLCMKCYKNFPLEALNES